MSFVDIFSPELTEAVFSHLSVPDLVNSSMVCVSWYEASNMSRVWRAAIKRSTPKDRFRKLSDLDRFTGIASNYDDNHCFKVDRQSPCKLSTMNPWKMSLCQNNFVSRNWSRSHNTVLARHQIKFEGSTRINTNMKVVYPSKLPQDRLYLPILVRKVNQRERDFLLIQLDGTPRISQKILSSKSRIPIVCIDRDCIVWVQDILVKYLSLVDNKDRSQIEDLGILISESQSDRVIFQSSYMMSMNDKYIVVGFQESFVKIWCKKTKQLKFTHKTTHIFSNINCLITACYLYHERIYFKHCEEGCKNNCNRSFIEIYDIKEETFLGTTFSSLHISCIVFNDKYYAMHSKLQDFFKINVCEIETNEIKISVNIEHDDRDPRKVWIVDDKVFYIEQDKLKFLSLVDWSISNGMLVRVDHRYFLNYDVWDDFFLIRKSNNVMFWDWKLERQHKLLLDISPAPEKTSRMNFHNDGTRLVAVSGTCINVIGFW